MGNDHKEGEDLKRDVGLCERSVPNLWNLDEDDGELNASTDDPCPYDVAAVETEAVDRVKVEEVLGLGGDGDEEDEKSSAVV